MCDTSAGCDRSAGTAFQQDASEILQTVKSTLQVKLRL